ncbi:MAG: arginine--tRNA ligase [Actinobacteria bacterium]|nr:arginine--tRNA ligase [Actinomycetota bacterium]
MLISFLKDRFLSDIKELVLKNNKTCEKFKPDFDRILKSVRFEEPKNREFGDLTTNAAMILSSQVGKKPVDFAQDIRTGIFSKWDMVEKTTIINPGFINFNLKNTFIIENLNQVFSEGTNFGVNNSGLGKKIQIEYVSSNPTGNLHIGHGRWGVMGDVLSSIYEKSGYEVQREYYVNDYGTQAKIFASCVKSIYLKKLGIGFPYPEEGYPESTVEMVAQRIFSDFGDSFLLNRKEVITDDKAIEKNAICIMLSFIKDTLSSLGVEFDNWFAESSLYENNNFEKTIKFLKDNELVYEQDNALWFKSTNYGDDKDRVVIRSDGNPTYFASDIMYLINKKERDFDFLIYILGADHHGYVSRLKAISRSLGMGNDAVCIIIGQLVRLVEGKEVLKMSRRKGKGMTLDDLIKGVGRDAVRYFFCMNSFDTHMDFDLSLARKKSSKNPVFYVQYAHARIGSIIRKLKESKPENISLAELEEIENTGGKFYRNIIKNLNEFEFKNISERNLAWVLSLFPDVVYDACKNNAPYFITRYLYRLSGEFHYFYKHNIIISKNRVNIKRLVLAIATKTVLKNGLDILGISAPEKM